MNAIRVSSIQAEGGKIIVGRLLPGTDLITGILKICEENNLEFGNIITIIGSLSKARFICATPDNRSKIGIKYGDPIEIQGPLEFLCGQGLIGMSDDEERAIHLHGVLCDKDVKFYAGHFVQGGNIVLATMEVVIQKLKEVKLIRSLDQETGFPIFKPKPYNKKIKHQVSKK